MTILTHEQIKRRIRTDQIVFSPLVSWAQIGESTADFRLGTYFIVFRTEGRPSLDIREEGATSSQLDFQRKVHVGIGQRLVIAPGMLVLGSTLEFVGMPSNLAGEVITRSAWGKLGVIIATAAWVHPGFRGCLTLEIVNHAASPVALYPGERIGQIAFHVAGPPIKIPPAKFLQLGATRPEYSKLFFEKDDSLVSARNFWHPAP